MERLGRMKLDLEAVMEDASEEVYSFQIQRSLIYLKFVGVVQYLIIIFSVSPLRRDYLSKSYRAQQCLGISSRAFIYIFKSG